MQLRDTGKWAEYETKNSDPYGKACVDYARAWADLMELRMQDGKSVEAVAKQASYDANTDGITGFMYGAAVAMLSQVWEHGEELRRWHNIATQIGKEGERANVSGGTLNPAILSIGDKNA